MRLSMGLSDTHRGIVGSHALQTKLKTPKMADLIGLNSVIKRTKPTKERYGSYNWRLHLPVRVVTVCRMRLCRMKFAP